MSIQTPTSDAGLLDLLRITGLLGVSELADAMEVTPTAVRQRLTRLMARNAIQREATRHGRGHSKHRYWLTDTGLRDDGLQFYGPGIGLVAGTCQVGDAQMRREFLRRIARALALGYSEQIKGDTPAERMQSLADLSDQRRIPVSVERSPFTAPF